jgi:HD-like signal output (HDOD) protein
VWEAEREQYGASHAEVGAYLLACWGLPRIVVEAVAHHHRPSNLGRTHFDPVGAVHVAEALAQEMEAVPFADPSRDATPLLDAPYLDATGAGPRLGAFRKIAHDVARRV